MKKKTNRYWTIEEVDFLENYYEKLPMYQITKRLKRTEYSISCKASRSKIKKKKSGQWTQKEIEYLKKHWGRMSLNELAQHLDTKNKANIFKEARILGLPPLYKLLAKKTKKKIMKIYKSAKMGEKSISEGCRDLGRSLQFYYYWRRKLNLPLLENRLKKMAVNKALRIYKSAKKGIMSIEKMCRRLSVSPTFYYWWRRRLNLPSLNRKQRKDKKGI